MFFFGCLLTFCVNAQSNQKALISDEISDKPVVSIDSLLAETDEIRTSDFQNFTDNLKELSTHQNNFTEKQLCFFRFLSTYELALRGDAQKSLNQLQEINKDCEYSSITIRVESLLANMYAISGKYQKALFYLDNILTEVEDINDENLRLLTYKSAYIVYDLLDQNQLSHDFAQTIIDQSPPPKQLCTASVYKYMSLFKINQTDVNEEEVLNVINFCGDQGENSYAQALNVNWIDYQLRNTESERKILIAYQKLLSSIDSITATQYKNLIVFTDSLMSRTLEQLGRKEEAVEYAARALEGTISLGDSQQKIDALNVLYNFNHEKGDYKKANDYLIEKNKTEIKFYTDKQDKLMAYQTIKHDNLAKVNQIEFLNQQNNMLSLENELAKKSKSNQLLLSYFFASLAVLLLYIGYRIKKKQDIYKSLSEMDYMTKIYNRKGMKDYMEYMLPYSEKKEETVAFGIFDLDFFKKINDQYGHNVGDWVIKTIVDVCKKLNNEKATFARLGGEEFAIIMRDSSMNDIKKFAEACRKAINSIETLEETKYQFNISASFGVTTTEISGYSFSDLMSDADEALYKSKENGRDQVSAYQA